MPEFETDSHRGWQRLRLRSADVEITIFPELGGTISSLRRRRDDLELLHQPPWDLPPRGHPLPAGSAETSRYDIDPGGWQSLCPNGGDAAEVDGAEWPVDGEARITPFDIADESVPGSHAASDPPNAAAAGHDAGEIVLHARLRRCPADLTKCIRLDDATVSVTESVRNVGADDLELMWGQQLRLGPPLVAAGAEVNCPASFVHPDALLIDDVEYDDVSPWPRTPGESSMINLRYLPETGSETRLAYLSGLSDGSVTVTNREAACRIGLSWDAETWPFLWYGFEGGADRDYPWYGAGHFLTLTPNSSWPARGLHDARRVSGSTLLLDPGETRSQTVRLTCDTPGTA